MSRVDELLSAYVAEHRRKGDADPIAYLDRAPAEERAELAAMISHFLATVSASAFDAAAFERFRARPDIAAMSERIFDPPPETLEEMRKAAKLSKQQVASRLAEDLGLENAVRHAKARYHDIETGQVDPWRVRSRVWESLAGAYGATVNAVRDAAAGAFGRSIGFEGAFARSFQLHAMEAPASMRGPSEAELRADEAFFKDVG